MLQRKDGWTGADVPVTTGRHSVAVTATCRKRERAGRGGGQRPQEMGHGGGRGPEHRPGPYPRPARSELLTASRPTPRGPNVRAFL